MNSGSPEERRDSKFEVDLAAVGSAWEQLEPTEPPQLVDQSVLNMARRHLEPPARSGWLRWTGAFATMTVVVLALFVVMRQGSQAPAPPAPGNDGIRLDAGTAISEKTEETRPRLAPESSPEPERLKRSVPAAATSASDVPQLSSKALEQQAPEVLDEDAALPEPDAWIERMMLLHEAGRREELKTELAAFRQAWPDYPLPPELLD